MRKKREDVRYYISDVIRRWRRKSDWAVAWAARSECPGVASFMGGQVTVFPSQFRVWDTDAEGDIGDLVDILDFDDFAEQYEPIDTEWDK